MSDIIFDEIHVVHELKHYLPSQTPLKDFIHHNSLHAFQNMKFYDAIFKASKIFGYQATLPLLDFRRLYKIGRIHEAVLDRIISERKGLENLKLCPDPIDYRKWTQDKKNVCLKLKQFT